VANNWAAIDGNKTYRVVAQSYISGGYGYYIMGNTANKFNI
jgi:hypothetical protein